jgi:hypothetical protein
MPWRDLPERFGDGTKVHLRFSRWAKSGVWERVFQHLAADADNEYAMTIVRAHQHSAGAQKRMARPVCKGDFTWRVWSASTYPVTGLEPSLAKMECARLGPDKVHGVEITTFLARLPKRRFDRYAICFSPPQTSFASPTRRPTLTCHQLIAGAWCSKARP